MATFADLESALDWNDIQGNVLGGFNKDFQTLIGFKFVDAPSAKAFLRELNITSLREVVHFKIDRKKKIAANGLESDAMKATWVAVAFSFSGLKLLSPDANSFLDPEFRNGLAASSTRLGDPDGSISSWVVGGPTNVPDIFLIVAADSAEDCASQVEILKDSAKFCGLVLNYEENGRNLSAFSVGDKVFPSGHEHFGFKDGVSQPGVRGVFPDGTFLTNRILPTDENDTEPAFAAPGQPLICAGQFVLGLARQLDSFPRIAGPPVVLGNTPSSIAPSWALNGSYLVFRRLRQNVRGFRDFVQNAASTLKQQQMSPSRLAAMLVGRWPSGAPIIRSPIKDDVSQTTTTRINAFAFGDENLAHGLSNDSQGIICPIAAHIRKVNPRDEDTDQGSASATLMRRILRRGIAFGPPLDDGAPQLESAERGLLFLSYQASISQQFEFLASQWMNNSVLPRNPSGLAGGLGFDMLVGQNPPDRTRFAFIRSDVAPGDSQISNQVVAIKDWVTPTGGGYFFAPSLSAISNILGK
jgi:Dyp-type peroxidase family